jgi:hypothetical protein
LVDRSLGFLRKLAAIRSYSWRKWLAVWSNRVVGVFGEILSARSLSRRQRLSVFIDSRRHGLSVLIHGVERSRR